MTYLITGATGNIGSLVVERLLARGDRPRVFVRDAEKARARYRDRVDIAVGDLGDTASLSAALAGVDALFLVNMGHDLDLRDGAAATAARAAGVKRLVKLSTNDVRQQIGTGVWHARGESAIAASGISFTFVQPSGFMVNALYWAHGIKTDGLVRSPTGEGRIPFIHSADIADVVVRALTTREHDGQSLNITGPEALSYAEMTAQIGTVIGKPLTFRTISDEEGLQQQLALGVPAPLAEARVSIWRAIREGHLAAVSDGVRRVLGREPIAFDRWAQENAAAFR